MRIYIVIAKNIPTNESIKVSKLPNGTYTVIYPQHEKVEVKNDYYKAFQSDDLKKAKFFSENKENFLNQDEVKIIET